MKLNGCEIFGMQVNILKLTNAITLGENSSNQNALLNSEVKSRWYKVQKLETMYL